MLQTLSLCYFVTGLMIALAVIWHMWSENRDLILQTLGVSVRLSRLSQAARPIKVLQVTEVVRLRAAA
jgi:hypothetical protein